MPKVHSHYDNLKVGRDASPAELRAAYRSLSQRYHPDRNAGNDGASRIMSVINVAYGVLSDPAKRREHDAWIDQAEREAAQAAPASPAERFARWRRDEPFKPHEPPPRAQAPQRLVPALWRATLAHLARFGVVYGLAGLVLFAAFYEPPIGPPPAPNLRSASLAAPDAALAGRYLRPAEAPNGQRWPEQSGDVNGYDRRNTSGLSEVTIDNAGNDADMFAKLVALDGAQPYPVRVVFVRARTRLKLTQISSGTYDLRYRNLGDGRLARSQFFTLEEVPTPQGPRASSVTVYLDKGRDSALQTYGLAEAEF
jgi:curved DNA-binding protein CbpA